MKKQSSKNFIYCTTTKLSLQRHFAYLENCQQERACLSDIFFLLRHFFSSIFKYPCFLRKSARSSRTTGAFFVLLSRQYNCNAQCRVGSIYTCRSFLLFALIFFAIGFSLSSNTDANTQFHTVMNYIIFKLCFSVRRRLLLIITVFQIRIILRFRVANLICKFCILEPDKFNVIKLLSSYV